MNWLNIELTTLRSEEYLGSDPTQRATWLNLLAYCADQENGGAIAGCVEWGGRKWLQLLGVTKEEVLADSELWHWQGASLHVWNYPKQKEIEVRRKRELGKKGGRPKKSNDTSADKPDGLPVSEPDGSVLLKRKGKEGKGIGKEEELKTKAKSRHAPPSLDDVILHAQKRAIGNPAPYITKAKKAFEFYEGNMRQMNADVWKDGNGNTVKNWKLKLNNNWFADISESATKPRAI